MLGKDIVARQYYTPVSDQAQSHFGEIRSQALHNTVTSALHHDERLMRGHDVMVVVFIPMLSGAAG